MKMTKSEYKKYVDKKTPNTPMWSNLLKAFVTGGFICVIGQGFFNLYQHVFGYSQLDASAATSVTMVFLGALLTGLRIYDSIAKFGGAGTLVPITGFANSIVSPALEFRSEGIITGMSAKMFTIAGPVLVFGISASIIYGIIYYCIGL